MSVALLDHGDTVPNRGTTSSDSPRGLSALGSRAVAQQRLEDVGFVAGQFAFDVDEVQEPGIEGLDRADACAKGGIELFEPEIRERRGAAEYEHGRGSHPSDRGAE